MKVIKFGGRSLANGEGIKNTLRIIKEKVADGEVITVVVSARGNATDELESILEKAAKGESYQEDWEVFMDYQQDGFEVDFKEEFLVLEKLFEGVALLGDYSKKIKDQVLAQGEVLSAKLVTQILRNNGIPAHFTDSRLLIKTDAKFGDAQPLVHYLEKIY